MSNKLTQMYTCTWYIRRPSVLCLSPGATVFATAAGPSTVVTNGTIRMGVSQLFIERAVLVFVDRTAASRSPPLSSERREYAPAHTLGGAMARRFGSAYLRPACTRPSACPGSMLGANPCSAFSDDDTREHRDLGQARRRRDRSGRRGVRGGNG